MRLIAVTLVVGVLFVPACGSDKPSGTGGVGGAGTSGSGGSAGAGGAGSGGAGGGAAGQGGTAGAGGAAGRGGAGAAGSAGIGGAGAGGRAGSGGFNSACTPGQDQECNDNPAMSALAGSCTRSGTCNCNAGFVINPSTGRCRVAGLDGGTGGSPATACESAGGSCVALVPGACSDGTVISASCGGGLGVECCVRGGRDGGAAAMCGGMTAGTCSTAGLSCQCCPAGGPLNNCTCSTTCTSDANCTDPARPKCNQPSAGVQGFCTATDFRCCWFCMG